MGGIVSVNHTGFTVSDLQRTSSFFRDVLGFAISPTTRHSGPAVERMIGVPGAVIDIAFATCANHTIELICYVEPRSRRASDLRHCDTGFAHVAFEVGDIDRMAVAVQASGYRLFSEPQVVPAGPRKGGKNVYAQGPDGIVIELQQAVVRTRADQSATGVGDY
jgi:catechol 2,3-dioxygenase-like lactoylglutathione lyase family enzyme